jgi:hypothetical protein
VRGASHLARGRKTDPGSLTYGTHGWTLVVDAGECVPCAQVLAAIVCYVWTFASRLELQVGWSSRRAIELN